MQLLVQNCLDPSRATEIFSVPKRRIFALPKIVRYRNKSGLQYSTAKSALLCHLSHLHLSCTSVKKAYFGHWVVLCSPVEESSWGPFKTKKQRRCFLDGSLSKTQVSEFAHTQMEKVWSRIILVDNNFFLSYSMFACFNVLVLCYYFFFNFRIIILVDRQCWLSGHNHLYITHGHIIIYFL